MAWHPRRHLPKRTWKISWITFSSRNAGILNLSNPLSGRGFRCRVRTFRNGIRKSAWKEIILPRKNCKSLNFCYRKFAIKFLKVVVAGRATAYLGGVADEKLHSRHERSPSRSQFNPKFRRQRCSDSHRSHRGN